MLSTDQQTYKSNHHSHWDTTQPLQVLPLHDDRLHLQAQGSHIAEKEQRSDSLVLVRNLLTLSPTGGG